MHAVECSLRLWQRWCYSAWRLPRPTQEGSWLVTKEASNQFDSVERRSKVHTCGSQKESQSCHCLLSSRQLFHVSESFHGRHGMIFNAAIIWFLDGNTAGAPEFCWKNRRYLVRIDEAEYGFGSCKLSTELGDVDIDEPAFLIEFEESPLTVSVKVNRSTNTNDTSLLLITPDPPMSSLAGPFEHRYITLVQKN